MHFILFSSISLYKVSHSILLCATSTSWSKDIKVTNPLPKQYHQYDFHQRGEWVKINRSTGLLVSAKKTICDAKHWLSNGNNAAKNFYFTPKCSADAPPPPPPPAQHWNFFMENLEKKLSSDLIISHFKVKLELKLLMENFDIGETSLYTGIIHCWNCRLKFRF